MFFAFLGGGAHIIITLMNRTPAEYGVWFAMSSIGYIAGNFTSSRLSTRYGIHRMIWAGIIIEIAGVALSTVLTAFALHWGPFIVFGPQMIVNVGNGLLLPGAIAGAVSERFGGRGGLLLAAITCVVAAGLGTIAIRRMAAFARPDGDADAIDESPLESAESAESRASLSANDEQLELETRP